MAARRIVALVVAGLVLAACGGDGDDGETDNQTTAPPIDQGQDAAAEAEIRNGIATANMFFTDGDTYSGFDATAAADIEPALTWVEGTEPGAGEVSIVVADASNVLLVTRSGSGTFVCGTTSGAASVDQATIGSAAAFADVDTVEECAAAS